MGNFEDNLFQAIETEFVAKVREALVKDVNVNAKQNKLTPLMKAVIKANKEIVDVLLSH